MIARRLAGSAAVLSLLAVVAAFGISWAGDAPRPRLLRDQSGPLFDHVVLTAGTPVTRCTGLRPRGGALTALTFDGHAAGALTPAVRIELVRGVSTGPTDDGCDGFVPEQTVYSGPLAGLPADDAPLSDPVAVPDGAAIAYRATIALRPGPAAGETAMALRLTGIFADRPPAPPPSPPPAPNGTAPTRCRQRRSGHPVGRTVTRGGRTLGVRTPAGLPVTLVRPLAVYVRTPDGRPPLVEAGTTRIPVRRAGSHRWLAPVPLEALDRTAAIVVRSGGLRARIDVPTRRCRIRVRGFLRAGSTLDLRIDSSTALRGATATLPAALGPVRGGRVTVRLIDAAGHHVVRVGRLGPGGRGRSPGLPTIGLDGRRLTLFDLPPRVGVVSVRLRFDAAPLAAVRATLCRRRYDLSGSVSGDAVQPFSIAVALPGDRCR